MSDTYNLDMFFSVAIILRNTLAPVEVLEGVQQPESLRSTMARPPDIDRPDLLAWGNVSRAEIEALIAAGALEFAHDILQTHPPEHAIWSIYRSGH